MYWYTGSYQPVQNFIGSNPTSSPIRHPHYQAPGPNYNPMSPTNQGVYVYGPPSMGPYPMPNYGMSQMASVPSHMMGSIPNPEQQRTSEQPAQGREAMTVPAGPAMVNLIVFRTFCRYTSELLGLAVSLRPLCDVVTK